MEVFTLGFIDGMFEILSWTIIVEGMRQPGEPLPLEFFQKESVVI